MKDPQEEIDAACKLLCDEAANHMKVRNYTKALNVYQKVCKLQIGRMGTVKLFLSNELYTRFESRYRLILASEIQLFTPFTIDLTHLMFHFLLFQYSRFSGPHNVFISWPVSINRIFKKASFIPNVNNAITIHVKINKIDSQSTRCHSRINLKVFVFRLHTNRINKREKTSILLFISPNSFHCIRFGDSVFVRSRTIARQQLRVIVPIT